MPGTATDTITRVNQLVLGFISRYNLTPDMLYKLDPDDGGHYVIKPSVAILQEIYNTFSVALMSEQKGRLIHCASTYPQSDQDEAMALFADMARSFTPTDRPLCIALDHLTCAAALLEITQHVPLPVPPPTTTPVHLTN